MSYRKVVLIVVLFDTCIVCKYSKLNFFKVGVMPNKYSTLVIHAPGVHYGGGLILLKSLLTAPGFSVRYMQLDSRVNECLELPLEMDISYIRPSILSRLRAEWRLRRITNANDIVLCFHGLPPIFPLRGRVIVFLQNRILLNRSVLSGYPLRTRIRLAAERWILRHFSWPVNRFIVQTPSMAMDSKMALGDGIDVTVFPYSSGSQNEVCGVDKQYDFVYVASDEPHKNHITLLAAWRLLAETGYKPSLVLTVHEGSQLAADVNVYARQYALNIVNLGRLQSREIYRLYGSSSALIYPSYSESLGLPLIEAAQRGMPILAPELDYVRDVVSPVQTFDPRSPVSIARAVMRFMGKPESVIAVRQPEEFFAEIMR